MRARPGPVEPLVPAVGDVIQQEPLAAVDERCRVGTRLYAPPMAVKLSSRRGRPGRELVDQRDDRRGRHRVEEFRTTDSAM